MPGPQLPSLNVIFLRITVPEWVLVPGPPAAHDGPFEKEPSGVSRREPPADCPKALFVDHEPCHVFYAHLILKAVPCSIPVRKVTSERLSDMPRVTELPRVDAQTWSQICPALSRSS